MPDICLECHNGLLLNQPDRILSDGTVVVSAKCNGCGRLEQLHCKPEQRIRRTGVSRCGSCGYEYFIVDTLDPEHVVYTGDFSSLFESMEISHICPNCDCIGGQNHITEEYGPLVHQHGHYRVHPANQKHNKK